MSNLNIGVALERIDHGVLPSNDLGRAFRFWSTFMGARINFHANLNARGLNREVPMIVFFTVANHPGFGLALQDFRLSPKPARRGEGVGCSTALRPSASENSMLLRATARRRPSLSSSRVANRRSALSLRSSKRSSIWVATRQRSGAWRSRQLW